MVRRKTILVVEDDPSVLTMLETILVHAGYDVLRAEDGEEGAARAEGYPKMPDLVLADIMMPKMDGYEMRGALLANRTTRGIPFIFLTAKTARLDKAKAFALGTYRYLTKPFTRENVLDEIRLALADAEERKRLSALPGSKQSGNLAETSVFCLVDLFIVGEWSGRVKLRSGYVKGTMRFQKGELVESDAGKGNNWVALEEMLALKEGMFEIEKT